MARSEEIQLEELTRVLERKKAFILRLSTQINPLEQKRQKLIKRIEVKKQQVSNG